MDEIIDFARYPIGDLASPQAQALIATCRVSLAERGAVRLPGFVQAGAIARMEAEAAVLAPAAHQQSDLFTAYIGDTAPTDMPADHPRRLQQRTSQAAVAWDLIPRGSTISAFYLWDGLTDFVAAVLGKDAFYRSADPLAACNLAYIKDGDELGWHFDSSEFSVTLQIQAPESGGVFEFVPHIRSDQDQNYDAVRGLLLGGDTGVLRSYCEAGALSIFRGHHSIHRVTPVVGPRTRVTAVLTYADRPDFLVSAYSRQLFYGRQN